MPCTVSEVRLQPTRGALGAGMDPVYFKDASVPSEEPGLLRRSPNGAWRKKPRLGFNLVLKTITVYRASA